MAKSPVPPEFDVALVTPPDGHITTVWWEWLQRYVRWDEACCAGGEGGGGTEGPPGPAGPTGPTGPAGPTGATGSTGPAGATGATGSAGAGVPIGGTTGQVLAKIDATNYNTQWVTPSGGGGSYLPLAGGTLTGNLAIAAPNIATLSLDDQGATSSGNASILNWKRLASNRWAMFLDGGESGANAGSNLKLARYSDAGTFLDAPLTLTRSNGNVSFLNILSASALVVTTGGIVSSGGADINGAVDFDATPTINGVPMGSGIADAPSDGAEYVRINGAWRLKSQSLDLAGLTSIDVSVPSGAKQVRIDGTVFMSTSAATFVFWRASLDGTTFLQGASDYHLVGLLHWSGSSGYVNLTAVNTTYGALTTTGDSADLPHQFKSLLHLTRPTTSCTWAASNNFEQYTTGASFLYGSGQSRAQLMATSAGSNLSILKLRFSFGTSLTARAPSAIHLEWIY